MSSGALHRNMYRRFNAKDTRSPSYETNHRGRKDRWPLEKLLAKLHWHLAMAGICLPVAERRLQWAVGLLGWSLVLQISSRKHR